MQTQILETLQQTSYSQQKTLLRCPKRYEYHYIRKLRPKRDDNRFLLGRAVHKFLEDYYSAQIVKDGILPASKEQAFATGFQTFKQYVEEHFPDDEEAFQQADLAENIIKNYHDWAKENDDFSVLGTEVPFEFEVANAKFRGVFDGIVERGGKYWILEHKTATQIKTEHTLRDKQISVYVLAAQTLGVPVSGVIYNTLKKAVPQKPKILKSGKLSKSLGQNITYESYLQAIHELGQSPSLYEDVLSQLRERENPFFHRESVTRTEETAKAVLKDIEQTEKLKQGIVQAGYFPRNDTKDCAWDCPFSELCLAELEGADTRPLLADKYKIVS